MEAAASERAAGMREVQTLAVVRVVPVSLAVIRGGLIRPDRFLAVRFVRIARPYLIEARFQRVRSGVLDLSQRRQRVGVLAGIHLKAAFVGLGGPRGRS